MKSRFTIRRLLSGWLVLIPSLAIIALMVLLTPSTSSASQPAATLTGVLPQAAQPPVCQSCHPQEYEAWKSTPHALDAGAACENCHGAYKPGHPDKATMQLPMASETCRTCHAATFAQWETSQHGTKNIECFDCHNSHTQGLRTGSADKLCAACHSERETQVAHATHGINGVNCVSCHMASETMALPTSGSTQTQGAVHSHDFKVASDVCAKCHESTIHTSNTLASLKSTNAAATLTQAERVPQLEKEVTGLEGRLNSLRSVSVMSMGLALGVGGFAGLILGIVASALWLRRKS